MIHAYTRHEASIPWWAAFGVPLIGVPLLIGLLALGAARDRDAGLAPEPEAASYVVEPAELPPQDARVELPGEPGETGVSRS